MLLSILTGNKHRASARKWNCFLLKSAALLLCLMGPTWLLAETISGTILDPSGAVVAGARIEIAGENLAQPIVLSSDGLGKFASPDLKPGMYSVRVVQQGFEPLVQTVNLQATVQLKLTLAIAQQHVKSQFQEKVWRSPIPIRFIGNSATSEWGRPIASTISP